MPSEAFRHEVRLRILRSPYKIVRDATNDLKVCQQCGKKATRMKKCSGCRWARYCGPRCQLENWSVHKAECCPDKALLTGTNGIHFDINWTEGLAPNTGSNILANPPKETHTLTRIILRAVYSSPYTWDTVYRRASRESRLRDLQEERIWCLRYTEYQFTVDPWRFDAWRVGVRPDSIIVRRALTGEIVCDIRPTEEEYDFFHYMTYPDLYNRVLEHMGLQYAVFRYGDPFRPPLSARPVVLALVMQGCYYSQYYRVGDRIHSEWSGRCKYELWGSVLDAIVYEEIFDEHTD